jgi:hypothetical protein
VKGAHLPCADAAATRRITYIHTYMTSVRKHVRSARPVMDQTECHEVLRRASVATVSILEQYRVSFYAALAPQLQLWHLHCTLVCALRAVHFLSRKETALTVERTRRLNDVDQDNITSTPVPCTRTSTSSTIRDPEDYDHAAVFAIRPKLAPAVHCVISTPKNALYRLKSKLFQLIETSVSN